VEPPMRGIKYISYIVLYFWNSIGFFPQVRKCGGIHVWARIFMLSSAYLNQVTTKVAHHKRTPWRSYLLFSTFHICETLCFKSETENWIASVIKEVFTAAIQRTQIFWDGMLCRWFSGCSKVKCWAAWFGLKERDELIREWRKLCN
jgi:hypothetical protein